MQLQIITAEREVFSGEVDALVAWCESVTQAIRKHAVQAAG